MDARRTAEARRAAALKAALASDEFTIDGLATWAELPRNTAQTFVRDWLEAGHIVMTRKVGRVRHYIATTKRHALALPKDCTAKPEENMWRAMRRYRQFSPMDIAAVSNAGGVEVSLEKARAYCRALLAAGYLRVIDRAVPGRKEAHYQLINDTGPEAPHQRRVRGLMDPNDGTFKVMS